mmetsp:Transcript_11043/g.46041  ORF Transcript_11043/g.46041 Transcript_11043/m.46041 type:complete len:82 (+) Transcript_11043:1699-1944(+)
MHLSESLGNIVEDSSKHFVELQAKSMQILSEMGMPPGSVNIWREGLLEVGEKPDLCAYFRRGGVGQTAHNETKKTCSHRSP